MLWGISEMMNARAFKPFPLCSAPLKTYWYRFSERLGTTEGHFLTKNVFWETAVGYLRNSECYSFKTFAIVFITPENLLVGISGTLGMKESHFLTKNVFWGNAVGYLRNSEC